MPVNYERINPDYQLCNTVVFTPVNYVNLSAIVYFTRIFHDFSNSYRYSIIDDIYALRKLVETLNSRYN